MKLYTTNEHPLAENLSLYLSLISESKADDNVNNSDISLDEFILGSVVFRNLYQSLRLLMDTYGKSEFFKFMVLINKLTSNTKQLTQVICLEENKIEVMHEKNFHSKTENLRIQSDSAIPWREFATEGIKWRED